MARVQAGETSRTTTFPSSGSTTRQGWNPWPLLLVAWVLPGWGTLEDFRYKTKPVDGNLWGERYGGGAYVLGDGMRRQVMFTFDDGPDHRSTPRLLDQLDRYGMKVVFFVNGHRLQSRPDARQNRRVLREIHRRGHLIGNHTFNHRDLSTLPDELVRREIDLTNSLVQRITGQRTWLFRPPFGKLGTAGRYLVQQRYTVVMWTLDPRDWQTSDPHEVLRRVTARLAQRSAGGIIDLHDTNPATVEAFPLIMEWFDQRNIELAARGQPTYELIGVEALYRALRRSQ
jgi:peptidoglycan/xylan/chitin deacetylase (PgdA/CDA1 family)